MKHEFTTSQGTVRIMLHDLTSGGDWMLAVKIGAATHLQVMKVRVLPFIMQEWQDLRTADGLIDINACCILLVKCSRLRPKRSVSETQTSWNSLNRDLCCAELLRRLYNRGSE